MLHWLRLGTLVLSILMAANVQAQDVLLSKIRITMKPGQTFVFLEGSGRILYEVQKKPGGSEFLLTLPGTSSNVASDILGPKGSLIDSISEQRGSAQGQLRLLFRLTKPSVAQFSYLKPEGSGKHVLQISLSAVQSQGTQSSTLMEQARVAIAKGKYDQAIAHYEEIIALGLPKDIRLAIEYQAVANQKARRFDLAKQGYQSYLQRYPDGDASDRVRQRLAVMLTMEQLPPRLTSASSRTKNRNEQPWNTRGGLYQYYRFSTNIDDAGKSDQRLNALSTDFQLSSRYRNESYDLDVRISGGQFSDFMSDGPGSSSRLSYLYISGVDRESERSVTIGRQRRRNGGVMGRFDGLSIENPFADSFSVNFVTGYPVDSSKQTSVQTDRHFYGINLDWQTWGDRLDLNFFIINQTVDGLTDRQAVGGQANYFDKQNYLFGLIDYDIHFEELNAVMLNGRHRYESGTSLSLSMNFRKSPYLSTRNALIGQPVDSVDELINTLFTEDEIRDLALDRTTESQTASVAITHPVSEKFDINGSLTIANLSETPSSGGVVGFEARSNDLYYSTELIGKSVFVDKDVSIFGVRYSDLDSSTVTSAYTTIRLPLSPQWRINPRFRIDYRKNADGSDQWIYSPRIQSQYRPGRNMYFELEAGALLYDQTTSLGTSELTQSYFFYMGYRYIF